MVEFQGNPGTTTGASGRLTERESPAQERRRRRRVRGILVAVAAAVIFGIVPGVGQLFSFGLRVGEGAAVQSAAADFYSVPTTPSASPGTIIRRERVVGAPGGSIAWRVLYHSTDDQGTDTIVSGLIVAPTAKAPPGQRTVVSWAHPTTGIAPRCAPSSGIAPFVLIEGLTDLIAAGYIVVATDYAGMGAAGPPSFLIGATEAANVLDMVRAAQTIPEVGASNRVVLWGHSQGGHAALFAVQRAASYAPELLIKGVAVAAPATNLGELLNSDIGDVSGVTIGAYAFAAYAAAYPDRLPSDPLASILSNAGADAVPEMAQLCLLGQNRELHAIATPLIGSFLIADPTSAPGWSAALAQNTPSQTPVPVPLFVAQGAKDTLVRPEITAEYVAQQLKAGATVESQVYPRASHATVAIDALPALLAWLRALA